MRDSGENIMRSVLRECSGYSLVEVLIALTLSSFIITLIATSWSMVVELNEKSRTSINLEAELSDRLRLQRLLGAMIKPAGKTGNNSGFSLIPDESGARLSCLIHPEYMDIEGATGKYCRLILTPDEFSGLKLGIRPVSESYKDSESTNDLEAILFQSSPQVTIKVLGQDGTWYSSWQEPDQYGTPIAVRFSSTESNARSLAYVELLPSSPVQMITDTGSQTD